MSTEVASTRLPKEMLREIDRAASARGIARSVYLAELIEQGTTVGEASINSSGQLGSLSAALAGELKEIRQSQRTVVQGLREIRAALSEGGLSVVESRSPLLQRLVFSTFFSEVLIKRVSALLYRNPSELSQVVREAREQAEAEAKLWRERLQGSESPKGSL
jgi:hypothetical protein